MQVVEEQIVSKIRYLSEKEQEDVLLYVENVLAKHRHERLQTVPDRRSLEIFDRIRDRKKNMPFTDGATAVDIIRRGRSGEMFNDDNR